ncbi:hypothetical protein B0H21DRAFT_726594, partial [Amylocystis lapponica]
YPLLHRHLSQHVALLPLSFLLRIWHTFTVPPIYTIGTTPSWNILSSPHIQLHKRCLPLTNAVQDTPATISHDITVSSQPLSAPLQIIDQAPTATPGVVANHWPFYFGDSALVPVAILVSNRADVHSVAINPTTMCTTIYRGIHLRDIREPPKPVTLAAVSSYIDTLPPLSHTSITSALCALQNVSRIDVHTALIPLPPNNDRLVDSDSALDSNTDGATSSTSQVAAIAGPLALPVDDNGCLIVAAITDDIAIAFGLPRPPKMRNPSRGGRRRSAQIRRQNAADLVMYQELLADSGVPLPPFPEPSEPSSPPSPQPPFPLPMRSAKTLPPLAPPPPLQHAGTAANGIVVWQHKVYQERAGCSSGGSIWANTRDAAPAGGQNKGHTRAEYNPRGAAASRWAPRPGGWDGPQPGECLSPPRRPPRERV